MDRVQVVSLAVFQVGLGSPNCPGMVGRAGMLRNVLYADAADLTKIRTRFLDRNF